MHFCIELSFADCHHCWLNGTIPDSALHLTGFQLIRADRITESSGKTRGGGLCFYINEGWCTDVTVLNKMCCPNLEAIFINCKPFYSPREFSSFILVSVYIPPDTRASVALELLADQITHTEQRYLDSFIIVLGGFNKAHLTRELPKYRQHITCPTRDSNILDHCYTVLKDAYHSVPRAALGLSDHCLVHLLPAYRQKLKSAKPVVKTVKRWTVEAEWDLQACFELTDWSVFGLQLLIWMSSLTLGHPQDYKSPSPSPEANQQLADDLNEFYCRFEKQKTGLTPSQPSTPCPSIPPTVSQPALKICEGDVCKVFRKQKIRKAKGPDGVSPACLKACAVQLSFIFTLIFNRSLELCIVPSCFKCSTIIPVPKKPKTTGLNDYRPVALTSVVMKSFERLVLAYLKDITGPLLDPLQFAYRANRSVDDAVNMGLHYILQHLDKPGTYARILFVDFSSAFNTIIPDILQNKLSQLSVPTSICQWITSFLTDRQQLVRLGKLTSGTRTINTGAPQGCVLSPLLFSLYTNDCTSKDPSVKLLKFADDTTVIGLIRDGDESAYRQEVEQLSLWCSRNNLELNTVEMTVDFRRKPPALKHGWLYVTIWLRFGPVMAHVWLMAVILCCTWAECNSLLGPELGQISVAVWDDVTETIDSLFSRTLDTVAPLRLRKIKENSPTPWYNEHTCAFFVFLGMNVPYRIENSNDFMNYFTSRIDTIRDKIVTMQPSITVHYRSPGEQFHSFSTIGFRPYHSTEIALIRVTNDLLLSSDRGCISLLVLLDLIAAFDTVDHNILLNRLENYVGISGSALAWFKLYLSDHHQFVAVNEEVSYRSQEQYGVPQGSVLGPLLFTLYMLPLGDIIRKYGVSFHCYADDTQLYISSRPGETYQFEKLTDCVVELKKFDDK
ncbi:hypothetical protein M9458_056814 [Cirrhinus mrigala]|uniref:Reverse transcriptase domain-containing protein n=1 Tax=Cirrhinus mrigala TaxID=683832 RepID=A0ABD0MCD6_CIRMR